MYQRLMNVVALLVARARGKSYHHLIVRSTRHA
jgi:hypothetical protein